LQSVQHSTAIQHLNPFNALSLTQSEISKEISKESLREDLIESLKADRRNNIGTVYVESGVHVEISTVAARFGPDTYYIACHIVPVARSSSAFLGAH
jgi:hypothetical protein